MNEVVVSSLVGFAAALVGALVVIAGWRVAHAQELRRDRVNAQRDLRVSFVVAAYRALERTSNRDLNAALRSDIENAIADIQLFGSASQVRLAQNFARELAATQNAPVDQLLSELRHELRAELGAEPVSKDVVYLRLFDGAKLPRVSGPKH